MIKTCVLALAFFSVLNLHSQDISQNIRGRIIDQANLEPLPGASVYIGEAGDVIKGTTSDLDGNYVLQDVPVGRFFVKCTFVGYEGWQSGYVELTSAKELILNIQLQESIITTDEVVIRASRNNSESLNEFASISSRSFSVEETQRYAGSINDPGRMALSLPGVQFSQQDNENSIVVRGNSPIGLLWRLEGVDIVNPNHFADKASTGGGISALSIFVLGESDFLTGAFPNEFANTISGVMDLGFRRGNSERRENRIQAGLIGLDFASEGPISRTNKKSSYLMNYRYSTLGLLNAMGVRVVSPNVSNNFQDLSFSLFFPVGNKDFINIFGLFGLSREIRDPVEDPAEWEFYNDIRTYQYDTQLGVLGASYTHLTSGNSYLKITAATSANKVIWEEDTINNSGQAGLYKNEAFLNVRNSLAISYAGKANSQLSYKTGLQLNHVYYDLYVNNYDPSVDFYRTKIDRRGELLLTSPYIQLAYRVTRGLQLSGGLNLLSSTLNDELAFEPRAQIRYQTSTGHNFKIAYGLHSQMAPLTAVNSQLTDNLGQFLSYPNLDLPFMKAHHLILGLNLSLLPSLKIGVEPYYQYLFDIPASTLPNRNYWLLNAGDEFETDPLQATGTGTNYGVDFTIEKFFSEGYFMLWNGSVFESTFITNNAGFTREYNTRFASNLISSLTTGREWQLENGRSIEAGLKSLWSNGLRFTPIDTQASERDWQTREIQEQAFSELTKPYFRIDMRLAYRKNVVGRSWKLSLDVQNLTNRVNEERPYYDLFKKEPVLEPQASLIPVISYTLDF